MPWHPMPPEAPLVTPRLTVGPCNSPMDSNSETASESVEPASSAISFCSSPQPPSRDQDLMPIAPWAVGSDENLAELHVRGAASVAAAGGA